MTDFYRDTDERYQKDPAFAAAVQTLESMAREHGFTPGELKQIAFKAALNIEGRRALPIGPPCARGVAPHDLANGVSCVRCGFTPRLAITGSASVGVADANTPEHMKVTPVGVYEGDGHPALRQGEYLPDTEEGGTD